MIEPGVCFCPVCGYTTTEPFYTADLTNHAAWLRRDPEHGYYMQVHGQPGTIWHLEDPYAPDRDGGLPDTVRVYLDGGNGAPAELRRCCPECFDGAVEGKSVKHHFKHFIGRVPMYVVALIGAPNTGKSTFLGALGYGALGSLNHLDYLYALTLNKLNAETEISKVTAMNGDKGNSNFIEIWERDKRNSELPAAMVLLLDVGGENYKHIALEDLYDAAPRRDIPLERLLRGDGRHNPGIDGAILVDPAVSGSDEFSTVTIANNLSEVLNKVPVAFVYTCADKLIAQEARSGSRDEPPLLTRDTFPNVVYNSDHISVQVRHFLPERIRERMVLQEEIALRMKHRGYKHVYTNFLTEHHAFLVRSCNPYYEDDKEKRDYKHQFNVADPIIWMLNRLKLFPVRLKGGNRL